MRKYNFLPGAPNPPEESDNPPERLSPQAKRLATIGGVAIVLVAAVYVYTSYFSSEPPSPLRAARTAAPAPPKPLAPPEITPEAETPPAATMAPEITQERERSLQEAIGPQEESPPMARQAEVPHVSPGPPEARVRTEKPDASTLTAKVSPPAETRASPAQAEGVFRLQVASLVVKQNALALEKRLGDLGYTPVVQIGTAPISRHRVYGGEFSSRQEAEGMARRLNVDGFPSNLVEGEDGKFRLEIGSYYNLNRAIDIAHTLKEKRYTPRIDSQAVPTPVYQVQVGKFASRAEALKALEALKKQGFTPIVVTR